MINGTRILNREKKRLMNTPMGKEHHALTLKINEGKRILKQYMNVSKLVQSAASDYEISSARPSDTSINKPFLRMPTKGLKYDSSFTDYNPRYLTEIQILILGDRMLYLED